MRRSQEYIRDWNDIEKQSPVTKEKERILREKYGLWPLLDPGLSFEEICERKNITLESLLHELWIVNSPPPAFEEIGTRPCMVKGEEFFLKNVILQKSSTRDDVILHIDFSRVNSITAFKSALMEWVDMEYRVRKTPFHLQETGKETEWLPGETAIHLELVKDENNPSVLSDIDYAKIIRIGDMKEKENLTNEKIALREWKEKFEETDDEPANPDGAIRNVSNYYKKYQQLVNGGYKKLSYP